MLFCLADSVLVLGATTLCTFFYRPIWRAVLLGIFTQAAVVAQWISLHCFALVTMGKMPFIISLLSKLMSILHFDLLRSPFDFRKACGIFAWRPVAYPYLLSERVVTAVIPYRHDSPDLNDFPCILTIDDRKACAWSDGHLFGNKAV